MIGLAPRVQQAPREQDSQIVGCSSKLYTSANPAIRRIISVPSAFGLQPPVPFVPLSIYMAEQFKLQIVSQLKLDSWACGRHTKDKLSVLVDEPFGEVDVGGNELALGVVEFSAQHGSVAFHVEGDVLGRVGETAASPLEAACKVHSA